MEELTSAYGMPYDPAPALARADYDELWLELYHQGDVGTASYAAVPELVRIMTEAAEPSWHPYALIASIELARTKGSGPALPVTLELDYFRAIRALIGPALEHLRDATDRTLIWSILAALGVAKDLPQLTDFAFLTDDEREELLG